MIARLRGTLEFKRPPYVLIDLAGLAYELQVPMSTFYHLPELGQSVMLHTHLQIREDAHVLYGFLTETERSLFRELIKISGVGPKVALAILSGMEVQDFVSCIERGSSDALVRIPGIGKKTAERLVIEMRDKLHDRVQKDGLSFGRLNAQEASHKQDAIDALVSLGYKHDEAQRAIKQLQLPDASSDILIRKALQGLARL